jgi:hypothetical protein
VTDENCLSFAELADYWSADATDAEIERIEAHVFACARCAVLLDESARLGSAIVNAAQAGMVRAFITDDLLNAMSRAGVRVRSYTVEPGASVQCSAWEDDEIVLARLRGAFAGVDAIDAEFRYDIGEPWASVAEVPVRPGTTELLLALPAEIIRSVPERPIHLTVRRAGAADVIAEYVIDHQGAHARA